MKNKENIDQRRRNKMWITIGMILLCLATAVCVILPPSTGRLKPFTDKNGKTIPGSLAEKTYVEVNGTKLGMLILAKDSTKPVLLFLGGGPAIPEYLLEKDHPSGLEQEFVVCYLSYRGTSLSYDPNVDPTSMTIEQYIDDVLEITNYLRERFGRDKIYLLGHSFGTYVGINTVARYPELYYSYIAMAQMSDQTRSEILAYNYMYEQYKAQGNDKMIKRFEECPVTTAEDLEKYFTLSDLRDTTMHDLGVGTLHNMHSVISGIFFPSLRNTVYTPSERINIWRGKVFSDKTPIKTNHFAFNAFEEIPEIDIPIYFLAGIYDYTCCYSLQKEYYKKIKAPLKAFYTFYDSAHSPLYEESDKAMGILINDVLSGKNNLADSD